MKTNNVYKNQGIIIALFCLLILFLVFKFINIITPFILGFVFAYMLEPIISYVTVKKKFNKTLSIFIILTTFFTIFFIILYYLIPGLINQTNELIVKLNVKNILLKQWERTKLLNF